MVVIPVQPEQTKCFGTYWISTPKYSAIVLTLGSWRWGVWFQTCPNRTMPARGASGGQYRGQATQDVFCGWRFGLRTVWVSSLTLLLCIKLLVAFALADSVTLSN